MTNPTNPFNWQMPTATDLVTDLPADFEVFGQAVATSMADLLGGTTGQVLSKASNTNMDFTWVAQDDSNAIQNAIVDAKGDLIAASAADTPARLAVGSNFAFLQADSSTATGLVWNNAAWTFYTPTISAEAGTITSSSASAFYQRIGKTCIVDITIGISNAGTGNGWLQFSLPFTSANPGFVAWMGTARENALTGNMCQIAIFEGQASGNIRKYDNASIIVTSANLRGTVVYEVA